MKCEQVLNLEEILLVLSLIKEDKSPKEIIKTLKDVGIESPSDLLTGVYGKGLILKRGEELHLTEEGEIYLIRMKSLWEDMHNA